jgi:hypothetical protein
MKIINKLKLDKKNLIYFICNVSVLWEKNMSSIIYDIIIGRVILLTW